MESKSGDKMIIKHFDLITIMALTFKLVRSLKKKKKNKPNCRSCFNLSFLIFLSSTTCFFQKLK